ncbi:MAG: type II secretion system protein [Meiothermus sp.]|uniref:type II secretion system protein n=1 Tax=Meiothermus sp. TaxID=1955249 RepID=UPI0025F19760|nr:type II secretion system protein [Meiothermus sp.]MCS7058183.1 type II secretion system protein [Meiothermus sp.]MCS7193302.1 type II secretion system protein [Meiothermus sp.]MCX7741554.1 type II secretion system protein [Meiothermus sp.]MDW8091195.1 type II secretion system protein [Meiothermus sp.]MDW8482020.1 type II secretion system protein [Meiothermus sp.]
MRNQGLTFIEVIVAAGALAVVLGFFTTLLVGNMRQTTIVGGRAQANQIGIFLGRQILEADDRALPAAGQSLRWNYGQLNDASIGFATLTQEQQFGNIALYRASITNQGTPSWAGSGWQVSQYSIEVCWQSPEGERCVQQSIIGPAPALAGNEVVTNVN